MMRTIVPVVVSVMFGVACSAADGKPLKVFILAGQSNMQGHVPVRTFESMADDPKTTPLLKDMRDADRKPYVCQKVWISSIGCAGNDTTEQTGKLKAGFVLPKNTMHDWNLGATGMRGWMCCDKLVTSVARQLSVTKIEANSPADGVIAVGDLILGVGGKEFSVDPRTELGQSLTAAETEAGDGKLVLTRWRAGKTDKVTLKLPVLGSYSATAPFDCPK